VVSNVHSDITTIRNLGFSVQCLFWIYDFKHVGFHVTRNEINSKHIKVALHMFTTSLLSTLCVAVMFLEI
jgi:hypothetical protein